MWMWCGNYTILLPMFFRKNSVKSTKTRCKISLVFYDINIQANSFINRKKVLWRNLLKKRKKYVWIIWEIPSQQKMKNLLWPKKWFVKSTTSNFHFVKILLSRNLFQISTQCTVWYFRKFTLTHTKFPWNHFSFFLLNCFL